jgi:hypothetical protein
MTRDSRAIASLNMAVRRASRVATFLTVPHDASHRAARFVLLMP